MIRFFGAMILSLSVIFHGFLKYFKLSKRVKYLRAIKHFSFSCADDMRFSQHDIFTVLKNNGKTELDFLKTLDAEILSDISAISKVLSDNEIDEKDISAFVSFLQGLGNSDIEGQKLHCTYYFNRFDELLKEAVSIQKEKGKIYKTMCIFAGIALFIILI